MLASISQTPGSNSSRHALFTPNRPSSLQGEVAPTARVTRFSQALHSWWVTKQALLPPVLPQAQDRRLRWRNLRMAFKVRANLWCDQLELELDILLQTTQPGQPFVHDGSTGQSPEMQTLILHQAGVSPLLAQTKDVADSSQTRTSN